MGFSASRAISGVLAGAFLLVVAAQAREADTGAAAPKALAILAARADQAAGTLTIEGRNLGGGPSAPAVTLGGAPLAVSSATPDTIVAALPEGLVPGTLLLTVTLAQGNHSGSLAVTIPASDIVTAGRIRIESTESDVRILAGDSIVTVDPSGGVRIESAGRIDVRAAGALDLRGQTVNIDSSTSMTLRAGSVLTVEGGATTNVRAGGQVAVTGATVSLN